MGLPSIREKASPQNRMDRTMFFPIPRAMIASSSSAKILGLVQMASWSLRSQPYRQTKDSCPENLSSRPFRAVIRLSVNVSLSMGADVRESPLEKRMRMYRINAAQACHNWGNLVRSKKASGTFTTSAACNRESCDQTPARLDCGR